MSEFNWVPPGGEPDLPVPPQAPVAPHAPVAPAAPSVPVPSAWTPQPWRPDPSAGAPPQAWRSRPYPQTLRGPRHRWWRPLLGLGVVALGVAVLFGAVIVSTLIAALAQGVDLGDDAAYNDWVDGSAAAPSMILLTNLGLAALIPIALLGVWAGHRWRPGYTSSVIGRLRARWLVVALGAVALVSVPVNLGLALFDGTPLTPEPQWPLLVVVVLLTTPLQAAGEEYFFRGWLPLAIGSWFARPGWGLLVGGTISTTLFAFAHGDQNVWLFADRFVFGALAVVLAWRTGGLEAGIALHVINNLIAFGFGIAYGDLQDSLEVSTAGALEVGIDVALLAVTALVLAYLGRRRRLVREVAPGWPVRA